MSPLVGKRLPARKIHKKFKPSLRRYDGPTKTKWQLSPFLGVRKIRRKRRGDSVFMADVMSLRLSCPRSKNWSAPTRRQKLIASFSPVLTNFYVPTPAVQRRFSL